MMSDVGVVVAEPPSHGANMPSFSLELLTKKREILTCEVTKLESCLMQRTELLRKLRQTHETLLTHNGKMEARVQSRGDNLHALRAALSGVATTTAMNNCSMSTTHPMDDLSVSHDKVQMCDALLVAMEQQQHRQLEATCMEKEEQRQRQSRQLEDVYTVYRQTHEQEQMMKEDLRAVAAALQCKVRTAHEAEERMNLSSNRFESEQLAVEAAQSQLSALQARLVDCRVNAKTAQEMTVEDLDQLQARKWEAEQSLRHFEDLLRKSGPAVPQDFEFDEKAQELSQRLQQLTTDLHESKFSQRDALLRRKEAKDLLTVTMANVTSREDQLKWLQRQLTHMTKEYDGVVAARHADEQAFHTFKQVFDEQMVTVAHHITTTASEAATISAQIQAARDEYEELQRSVASRSAARDAHKQLHATKAEALRTAKKENKSTETAVQNLVASLSLLQSKRTKLERTVEELSMATEDELSQQIRLVDQITRTKETIKADNEAHDEMARVVEDKLVYLQGNYARDADRRHVAQLVKRVTEETTRAAEEERLKFQEEEQETIRKHNMAKKRYADLLKSMREKYRDAVNVKRIEYEELVAEAAEKEATAALLAEKQAKNAAATAEKAAAAKERAKKKAADAKAAKLAEEVARQAQEQQHVEKAAAAKEHAKKKAADAKAAKLVDEQQARQAQEQQAEKAAAAKERANKKAADAKAAKLAAEEEARQAQEQQQAEKAAAIAHAALLAKEKANWEAEMAQLEEMSNAKKLAEEEEAKASALAEEERQRAAQHKPSLTIETPMKRGKTAPKSTKATSAKSKHQQHAASDPPTSQVIRAKTIASSQHHEAQKSSAASVQPQHKQQSRMLTTPKTKTVVSVKPSTKLPRRDKFALAAPQFSFDDAAADLPTTNMRKPKATDTTHDKENKPLEGRVASQSMGRLHGALDENTDSAFGSQQLQVRPPPPPPVKINATAKVSASKKSSVAKKPTPLSSKHIPISQPTSAAIAIRAAATSVAGAAASSRLPSHTMAKTKTKTKTKPRKASQATVHWSADDSFSFS